MRVPFHNGLLLDCSDRGQRLSLRDLNNLAEAASQKLETALGAHGVAIGDVAAVLHTHCHIDHAGQDDRFPMTTPVVMNRRELEHSVSGLMGAQYPPEYVKHHVDRLHTPGALRLLDLELSGPDEIYSGIVCEAAGGHTEGSMIACCSPHTSHPGVRPCRHRPHS